MVKMFVLILAITLSVLTISVAVQVTTRTLPPLTPYVFPILACATGVKIGKTYGVSGGNVRVVTCTATLIVRTHVFPILACATGVLWVTRIALSCRDDILNSNESLERELQKSNEVLGQISAQLKFQSIVNQLEDPHE